MNLKLSHSSALIAAALFTGTMVGCASTDEPSKQVEVKPEDQNIINKTKITQALLNITPGWYLAPPQSTRGDIYAVATAVNSDIQFATNRAVLLGEQQVVKKMATEVSSLETNDITNSGGSNNVVSTEYIEARINQAGLFGHKVVKREYFPDPETGEFRVFVMIHLDAKTKSDILTAATENDEILRENEQLQKTIEDLKAKAEAQDQAKKNA